MAARSPSANLTGTSSRSEPETLMGRWEERANFWDAAFCNRPRTLRGGEGRSRRSGDGSGIEPVKMFGAVRGSPSHATATQSAETVDATVRIVKLAPNYFWRRNSVPSGVRTLDFGDHKEVRPLICPSSVSRSA